MSKDLNQVSLIGRLTKDPELRYTATGYAICGFSIANNDCYKKDNEVKEEVSFFDITAWGAMGENCNKYLKKGSMVAITGKLKQQRWNDKDTNETRSKIGVVADQVQFLSRSESTGDGEANSTPAPKNHTRPEVYNQGNRVPDPWENQSPKDQDSMPDNTNDDIPF
ncbi:MAG: single-stranded DNA-binding protein [Dehalococcoidia bacterium]|nr:MAG: single-stranded DNA-binding protein [Dehalococcoidia bacterium]